MSDNTVPQEQPSKEEHDVSIEEIAERFKAPGDDVTLAQNEHDEDQVSRKEDVAPSSVQSETHAETEITAAGPSEEQPQPSQQVEDDSTDAEQQARARDIEREASEHLARRASEMASGGTNDGTQSRAHSSRKPEKQDLPATPPPPVPPRKDSLPAKAEETTEEYDEKHPVPDDSQPEVPEAPQGTTEVAGAEIQHIIDQFQEGMGGMREDEIMSPVLGRQHPVLVLPPRSSSLSLRETESFSPQEGGSVVTSPLSPQGTGNASISSRNRAISDDQQSTTSVKAGSIFQPPPPSPDPEPALPFDFHRFLEQLRHRTADPVARFLRSFLNEFGKKQWMVHEQVKIISDFLEFITKKMGQCEVWRTVSDAEFDNAREGMEKLVMNRLYSQTFSPAIPPMLGSPRKLARSARAQADQANPVGAGRRGQHQEDVERDEVIAQKIKIYGWIEEGHLDIKPVGEKGKKFLTLAQQELLKINTYRAPRDKVICVLNCCKVIFGYLKNSKADQSADAFVPLLIYTVLRARPEHLVSNVQYIWRFRNQDKMGGEAGYYMSSLLGVVTFIENLDRTNLTISDQEFEAKVEQAVSAIAEKDRAEEYEGRAHATSSTTPLQRLTEKSTLSRAEVTPHNSTDPTRSSPQRSAGRSLSEKVVGSGNKDEEDVDAVTGLLRSIQKPLNSIGRMFSDEGAGYDQRSTGTASKPTSRTLSPAPQLTKRPSLEERLSRRPSADVPRTQQEANAAEARAQQASIEGAQAQRIRVQEHKVVVETLQSMFPNLDKDVIADVVRSQEGNVGKAVDACLALSG